MDTYRRQTRKVIDRFLDNRLSFPDCIAALADLMPSIAPMKTDRSTCDISSSAGTFGAAVWDEKLCRGSGQKSGLQESASSSSGLEMEILDERRDTCGTAKQADEISLSPQQLLASRPIRESAQTVRSGGLKRVYYIWVPGGTRHVSSPRWSHHGRV